jgi:hypothetical protein
MCVFGDATRHTRAKRPTRAGLQRSSPWGCARFANYAASEPASPSLSAATRFRPTVGLMPLAGFALNSGVSRRVARDVLVAASRAAQESGPQSAEPWASATKTEPDSVALIGCSGRLLVHRNLEDGLSCDHARKPCGSAVHETESRSKALTRAAVGLTEAHGDQLRHDRLRQRPVNGEMQRALGHRVTG